MDVTRRNVIAIGALGAAGVAVAGCSSGETSQPATTPEAPAATGPAPAASGAALVATADVPVDSGVIVDSGETKVVVTQPTSGEFVGLSAVCPHQSCLVNQVEGQTITCPCHGSQFSIVDGAVLQGPATTGLTPVPVTVNGDQVILA
jgi:nitrite reductase/ring-hydroxylating ferredoxin subunit